MKPLLLAGILGTLAGPVQADRLRISPDDLRLRVAVSEELPPSLRREIKELARSVPLPVSEGKVQSEQLFLSEFGSRGWADKRMVLARYYFLVSRLEQSQTFSEEFLRREALLKNGAEALKLYVTRLNPLISRGVYTESPSLNLERVQDFPLTEVSQDEDGGVLTLHRYPAPSLKLGRQNLKLLRETAQQEREELKKRLTLLQRAERDFLDEASQIGWSLLEMRGQVRDWVKVPGEGLPFSL